MLDALGLRSAVEWYVRLFERRSGIASSLKLAAGRKRYDDRLTTAVFRIMQEALTNVVRHASAQRVSVLLDERPGQLTLAVEDDGVGMRDKALAAGGSLGLLGMTERARALGGTLRFDTGEFGGTRVRLSLPLTQRQAAEPTSEGKTINE